MVTKRDLVIAALCTFCLTSALLTILPVGSNYKTSGIGEYDPWVDINDDGRINILDAINLGSSFGTTGNPTKNVSVTNWPTIIQTMAATNSGRIVWVNPLPGVSNGYHDLAAIETRGFRKLYFLLVCEAAYPNNFCNLTIGWRMQGAFNESANWYFQVDHFEAFENATRDRAYLEFDIKGETLIVWLGDTFANSYEMAYYMTA
jgi:hypothetical protein